MRLVLRPTRPQSRSTTYIVPRKIKWKWWESLWPSKKDAQTRERPHAPTLTCWTDWRHLWAQRKNKFGGHTDAWSWTDNAEQFKKKCELCLTRNTFWLPRSVEPLAADTGRSSFTSALILCYHISFPLIARRRPPVVEDRCKKIMNK